LATFLNKSFSYILLILTSVLSIHFTSYSQGIASDSLLVRNFSSAEFKVASFNFDVSLDENGVVYFANENGVLQYDGSFWKIIPIRNFAGINCLKMSLDGRMYVGGENEFGYLERDSIGVFEYHSLRVQLPDTLEINQVWNVVFRDNSIYFQSYRGIFKFDGESVRHIDIKDGWIFTINNEPYVSVFTKGLAKLVGDSLDYVDTSFLYPLDAPFREVPYSKTKSLILTEEHGLYEIDLYTKQLKEWDVSSNKVFKKHGIYDGIVWDDSTFLISTTRGGVFWINRKGDIVRKLTENEGLGNDEQREFIRDKRGNLWLTGNGITHVIFPNLQDTTNFKAVIQHLEVNDSLVNVNAKTLKKTLHENGPINSLVFNYSSPGFDKADLQFSYMLEGFDNKWSAWNENVKKEYSHVPGGVYTFKVKAKYNNELISPGSEIIIEIPILWYRSTPAYVIAVFLLIMIIWAGAGYRAATLRLKNKQLEHLVNERTMELVAQKEELVVANNELDHFVYRSSHDLIAPLKSMKGLINIARMEPSKEQQEQYFSMMENSILKLEDFIRSILEYSSNSKEGIANEKIDFNGIIDDIIDDLKYFEQAEKVTLHREIENIDFHSDAKRLKIVLSNLIANAIKYHNYRQEKPRINVNFRKEGEKVLLEVTDNGQGIAEEYLSTIFNMFVRASDASSGSGLGLYIVKDTVEKLGGKISVDSQLGVGTTFTIEFV